MRQQWQTKKNTVHYQFSFFRSIFAFAKWNCNGFSRLFSPIYFSLFDIVGKSFPPSIRPVSPSSIPPSNPLPSTTIIRPNQSQQFTMLNLTPKWIGLCRWMWAVFSVFDVASSSETQTWPRMKKLGQWVCASVRARAKKKPSTRNEKLFFIVITKVKCVRAYARIENKN